MTHHSIADDGTPMTLTFQGSVHCTYGEPAEPEQLEEQSEAYTPPIDIKPTITPIKTEPRSIYTIQQHPIKEEEDTLLTEDSDSDSEETFPLPPVDPYLKYRQNVNLAIYKEMELRAMKDSLDEEIQRVVAELDQLSNRNTPAGIATLKYLAELNKQYQEVKQEHEILVEIRKLF